MTDKITEILASIALSQFSVLKYCENGKFKWYGFRIRDLCGADNKVLLNFKMSKASWDWEVVIN